MVIHRQKDQPKVPDPRERGEAYQERESEASNDLAAQIYTFRGTRELLKALVATTGSLFFNS